MGSAVGDRDPVAALRELAAPVLTEGPASVVVVPRLLGRDAADTLLAAVLARADEFVPNDAPAAGHRRGRVLAAGPELTEPVTRAVLGDLDGFVARLGIDVGAGPARHALEIGEVAVTAHVDGDFLGLHRDDGWPLRPNGRVLSFVYWLHRWPRPFSGGRLRLCAWVRHDRRLIPGGPATDVEPDHDTLAVFPSCTMHEVLPVRAPSDRPADGRVAVTGFVRRRTEAIA